MGPHSRRVRGFGVAVRGPEDYLNALLDEHAEEIVLVVNQMAADRRRPRMTVKEVLNALVRAGVLRFARRVHQHRFSAGR